VGVISTTSECCENWGILGKKDAVLRKRSCEEGHGKEGGGKGQCVRSLSSLVTAMLCTVIMA